MTTQTIASTSTPSSSRTSAASPAPARRAPAAPIAPNPHSTTGAWILTIVTLLMAATVAVSFYLASQITF